MRKRVCMAGHKVLTALVAVLLAFPVVPANVARADDGNATAEAIEAASATEGELDEQNVEEPEGEVAENAASEEEGDSGEPAVVTDEDGLDEGEPVDLADEQSVVDGAETTDEEPASTADASDTDEQDTAVTEETEPTEVEAAVSGTTESVQHDQETGPVTSKGAASSSSASSVRTTAKQTTAKTTSTKQKEPTLTAAAPATSPIKKVGWNRAIDGTWYYSNDGKTAAKGWISSGGAWYYLDGKTGAMKADEAFAVGGTTYVAGASGACPANSWVKAAGKWYYTNGSCAVRKGWVSSGGAWYYLDGKTGAMKANQTFASGGKRYVALASGVCPASAWALVKSHWYLTDASCACRTGWITSGGKQYYLDPSTGIMKAGESFKVDGVTYVADGNGVCGSSGWVKTAEGWQYTSSSGAAYKGWQKIDGDWYYFAPSTGIMKEGEVFSVGGVDYVARANGTCPANMWVTCNGKWYRTNGSCAIRTGWFDTGVTWYYLDPAKKGASTTGSKTIDGKTYFFYSPMGGMAQGEYVTLKDGTRKYAAWSGELKDKGPACEGAKGVTGWYSYEGDWYYLDKNGKPKTGWIKDGNKRYWLDQEGVMVTGTKLIDGKSYWFGVDGALIKELTGTASDLIKVARADIGYSVDDDPETGSKFGRWYDDNCNPWQESIDYGDDGVAYCVMAVSYWMYQANVGAPGFPRAGCEGAALYARMESRAVAPENLSKGMLVLFDWDSDGEPDHIGVVEKKIDNSTYQTIEGNTSLGTGGSQDNGGHVARRTRDIESVFCGIKPYYM